MILLKMLLSILVLHVLLLGLALSPRIARPWVLQDDLADSSSWSLPPLVLLREIHANRLANYDCKGSAPCQSQSGTGYRWTLAARRTGFRSNRRPDLSFFRNSTTSSSHIPCKERTPPTFLSPPSSLSPSTGSRAEQLRLPRSQRIVAAAVDSMLCTELADLEPQEYSPKRVL